MALGEIAFARKIEPDLKGTARDQSGWCMIRFDQPLKILDLNADVKTTGLALGVRALGDAHLTAETKNGLMNVRFDSNVAESAIHGDGTVTLTGDYPVDAKLTFSGLGLSAVAAAIRGPSEGKDLNLEGSAAGEVTLSGSARKPDLINASIDVTQFELHPLSVTGAAKNVARPGAEEQRANPGDTGDVGSPHRQRPFPGSRNGSRPYRRRRASLPLAFRSASRGSLNWHWPRLTTRIDGFR